MPIQEPKFDLGYLSRRLPDTGCGRYGLYRAGTYNERVIPENSGSAGNYITYAAYPGETVTIDGKAYPCQRMKGYSISMARAISRFPVYEFSILAQAGISLMLRQATLPSRRITLTILALRA